MHSISKIFDVLSRGHGEVDMYELDAMYMSKKNALNVNENNYGVFPDHGHGEGRCV